MKNCIRRDFLMYPKKKIFNLHDILYNLKERYVKMQFSVLPNSSILCEQSRKLKICLLIQIINAKVFK